MAELNSFAKIETNFNAEPYYDDWIKSKGFLRVLFKPGTAVQARELTQLQTILGDQIAQLADNSITEGSIIRGGEITVETGEESLARKFEIDTNSKFYQQLEAIISNESVDWREILIGNTLVYDGTHNSVATKIKFTIVDIIQPSSSTQNLSLVGVYQSDQTFFGDVGTNIYSITDNKMQFSDDKTVDGSPLNDIFQRTIEAGEEQIVILETVACSFVKIKEGVIYSKGCLVYFPEATKVISATSTTETAKIGIQVYESIVTSAEDSSLFDNAAGSTNENAPGADRFKISAELSIKTLNTSEDSTYGTAENNDFLDFYELTRLTDGVRIDVVLDSPYGDIEDMLAERIYDLAGDFLVNKGDYGITLGEYQGDDPTKIDNHYGVNIKPGKAYIQGYEVEKSDVTYLEIPAERSFTPPEEKIKFESGNSYLNYFIAKIGTSPEVDPDDPTTIAADFQRTNLEGLQDILVDGKITLQQSVEGTVASNIVTTTEPHRLKTGFVMLIYETNKYNPYFVKRLNSKKFSLYTVDQGTGLTTTKTLSDSDFSGIVDVGTARIRDFRFKNDLTNTENAELEDITESRDFLELYVYDITLPNGIRLSNVNMATDGTDKVFDIVRSEDGTVLREPSKNSMLYRLPDKRIEGVSDMSYAIADSTTFTTSSDTDVIEIVAPSGGYFIPQSITAAQISEFLDEVVVYREYKPQSGTTPVIIGRIPYTQLDFTSNKLTITLADLDGDADTKTLPANTKALIFYKLYKNLSTPRSKTYTENYEETVAVDANGVATLGKYNVVSIVKVTIDSNGNEVEVGSDLYTLKSGQTENYYDYSSIKFSALSNTTVKVIYNYFEIGVGSEPFTVDSYTPKESRFLDKFTDAEGNVVELADCLDFRRPKRKDGPPAEGEPIFPLANDANAYFDLYYTVYYSRYDKVVLNKQGEFNLIQGQASKTPQLPADESNALTLWNLYVQPYTYTANEIQTTSVAKVRRRVKDIVLIEEDLAETKKKISLVEKELEAVKRAKDGDNKSRTSMATLVDDFSEPLTVDFAIPETNCSIDTFEGALKPQYTVDNYKFVTKNLSTNYKKGDIITAKSTSITWADNLFTTAPKSNNFWWTALKDGFLTGGFLYEYIIKNINSGVGYVLPISAKTDTPTVNLYPEVEVWKDDKTVPTVSESINNKLYKAYEDLRESGSNNKELLSVTWPITTNSDVNGTPESLIQNDFGEIIYDKNIIETLAENTVVFKANGFTSGSNLTLELGGSKGFYQFPTISFSSSDDDGYSTVDVNESTFPYELTINADEGGTIVPYYYKIIHKYVNNNRYYYDLLPKELFDSSISTDTKEANKSTYYAARNVQNAIITSIVGNTTIPVGGTVSFSPPTDTTSIIVSGFGSARGAICIKSKAYKNTTQAFSMSIGSTKATKQYYSLLDSQDKIVSQNKTRIVDTSSGNPDTSGILQPFVVREPNGIYLDSVDLALMNNSRSGSLSIYITKKKNGAYQSSYVPGSFSTLSTFVPSNIQEKNFPWFYGTWTEQKTYPGINNFKFDSPLYLDPGDYAIGFVGNNSYKLCVLSTTNDATLKNMPNTKTFINCRINRRSFDSSSATSTLKLALDDSLSSKDYSLVNLNGTFISGLTGCTGPSFLFKSGSINTPIIPNKNTDKKGAITLDANSELDFSISGSSYTSPLVDLQTLNLIAVKYQESDVDGLTDLDIIEMTENFTYISKAVRFPFGNKANSIIGSADIYVPSSSLGVKMFIKTDSEGLTLEDEFNEWIEIPISQEESEVSKISSFQSSNNNDTKKFTFKSEELEPYESARIKLIMYSYKHFDIPSVQAFNANFYLTTDLTAEQTAEQTT